MSVKLPRRPLTRVDVMTDTSGLPPALIDGIEADGGLWWAGDAYTSADQVVNGVRRTGAKALRLDFRDLTLLERLPDLRYLHLRSDGRPQLDPVQSLAQLRALIVDVGAQRGSLDPMAFGDLRWLRIGLGGKGGQQVLPSLQRGHGGLAWLSVSETKTSIATDLTANLPALRVLRIRLADHLRDLGDLAHTNPRLQKVSLYLTGVRDLGGLAGLAELTTLEVFGGKTTDITPLAYLPRLEYLRLELTAPISLEPLRAHPSLRIVSLNLPDEPDRDLLASMPKLVAVGRANRRYTALPWPDVLTLDRDDPLRVEWQRAMQA